jgi:hypothetical protein
VIDVTGATPSQLVLPLRKDSNAYLLDRNNLGGIASPVAQANVSGINKGTSVVTHHTRRVPILPVTTKWARSAPTKLRRQVRRRSCLPEVYAAGYTVGVLNTGTDNVASFSKPRAGDS